MKTMIFAGATALAALATPVAAADYFGSYDAFISRDDVVNSSGARLGDMGAILRQDRANVHRYNIRQRGDAVDGFFGQAYLREQLQAAVNDSNIPGYIEEAIMAGNARITVDLYGFGDTLQFVEIEIHQ